MAVTSIKCPGCGAGLTPPKGAPSFTCEYCGTHVRVSEPSPRSPWPKSQNPQVRLQSTTATTTNTTTTSSSASGATAGRIILFVLATVGLVFAGVGYTVYSAFKGIASSTGGVPNLPGFGALATIPGLDGTGFALWSQSGTPLQLQVAGEPAFLGRIRVMPEDELFFVAVNAEGKTLYRVGPFSTYIDGYRFTYAAVAGDRLIISDATAKLHLLDANTGKELKVLELSDRIKTICGLADGSQFWAQQVDKRTYTIDPQSGEFTEGPRPDNCRDSEDPWKLIPSDKQRKKLRRLKKKIENFEPERYIDVDDLTILAGEREPGTAVPQVVAVDAKGSILWRADVPSIDPLRAKEGTTSHDSVGGGRYVTVYGEGRDTWHLTAFDIKTGDRLWENILRPIFAVDSINGVFATDDFILVTRTSSLEVHDPKTGALRGTIGRETYDK